MKPTMEGNISTNKADMKPLSFFEDTSDSVFLYSLLNGVSIG
jgi:hypothetical protein